MGSSPYPRVVQVPRRELALSGFLLVIAVASVLAGKPDEGPLWVTLPVAVLLPACVAVARRYPLAAVVLASAASLFQTVLAAGPGSLWALASFLLLTVIVAFECEETRAMVGGAIVLAGQFAQERLANGVDYVFIVILFGGAWLAGRALRSWRSRATYAEQHRDDLARLAVAEERVRIARELHDVVAHSLSVIAVQADAAEAALSSARPELAGVPMQAIRRSARDALTDTRQMLSLMREDPGARTPTRGIADLPDLVQAMREAGQPVDAELSNDAQHPNPAVSLTAYRVVQEGLTNALRYGDGGPATVRVVVLDDAVEVTVGSSGAVPREDGVGGGRGLIGLRERVSAAGGDFVAHPVPGGFEMRAHLPVREEA